MTAAVDSAIADLVVGAQRWANTSIADRIGLLEATHRCIAEAADEWVDAAVEAKDVPASAAGEEWISGPWATLSGFKAAADSLRKIDRGRSPASGVRARKAPGNRTALRMLPSDLDEFTLFNGFTADVWLKPGVTADQARERAGLGARRLGENGGVGLVLGAGNITAIGPTDVLYELIAFNRVSVLKLNPTFDGLESAYSKALAPLIDAGLLRIVRGGAEVGGYLTAHPQIDHVHITGSQATHDLIVFGSTTDKSTIKLDKPISSELGGVSPVIVIPGEWSDADLKFQAENIATQRLHNSGHNCVASQLLILPADWVQRDAFLDAVRTVFAELEPRATWYPGSQTRIDQAVSANPEAEKINGRVLVELEPDTASSLRNAECFTPVLAHVSLPGESEEFFAKAIAYANDEVYGTLGASVIVAPDVRRKMGARFGDLLAELRYGSVGVNVWSAIGFLIPTLAWGAYPGNTLDNVGSGIGLVHNAHLLEDVEKSVAYGPFRPFPRSILGGELALSPKPPWFVTAKTGTETSKLLTRFAAKPSWFKLPGIFNQAFRG